MIIETDKHIKLIEWNKIKNIMLGCKYSKYYPKIKKIIFKIKLIYLTYKKRYRWIILTSSKIKHIQNN